ncbi:MAG: thymidine phosphorylase [Chloroherpetonaceae bacterium]|nr:thymidine phosphorylase [Chthonomonadaceae bacterium]MDW8208524.1 thymidine phosphorylase [Chloroherpetonaceae bacterium]
MNAYDILYRKRQGACLTPEEIGFLIQGHLQGHVPDYQIAAWLMAVCLQGMDFDETLALTRQMRDSGQKLAWSVPGKITLDKHSTGGVGDKTTLVVIPALAACGVPVLKMSGRGLGHSGGTVDKLEAIPGFRTTLSVPEALAQVQRTGAVLIGQSAELAPADKKLYALRDVTATVDCIPLIASSIMSKKLASGAQRILLDVKVGNGGFLPAYEQAERLAQTCVAIGAAEGVATRAVLSRMDTPLGYAVGNALEVREAVQFLLNPRQAEPALRTLCLELIAQGLEMTGVVPDVPAGRMEAERALTSGAAAAKFAEIVATQGGPATCQDILDSLPQAPITHMVRAPLAGTVQQIDARAIGLLARDMGAGRIVKDDPIDLTAGITLSVTVQQTVRAGDPLATLHVRAQDQDHIAEFERRLLDACTIEQVGSAPASAPPDPVIAVLG